MLNMLQDANNASVFVQLVVRFFTVMIDNLPVLIPVGIGFYWQVRQLRKEASKVSQDVQTAAAPQNEALGTIHGLVNGNLSALKDKLKQKEEECALKAEECAELEAQIENFKRDTGQFKRRDD